LNQKLYWNLEKELHLQCESVQNNQWCLEVFNYNYDRKELTESQKLGMVTLIYEKNYPLSLSNYRPITILNTDAKLSVQNNQWCLEFV
jgi:hypothetical protein